ncbi:uncharacterized protein LOC116349115 [Contarinia nasturtii]|uniref:uncharacterized protein LOC116349115 n=1 Tax=Contarinia nasturtii TaxID=265458 RepID=UPI0012D42087|nr:uncharacterized protein LOC116349115 [Contarinia nasturtii]
MTSKCSYFLVVLICAKAFLVTSLPIEDNSNENALGEISLTRASENIVPVRDLSDEDIEKMKQEMSNELRPAQMEKFVEILQKFKKGTSTKDKVEGMVQLIVFSMGVKSSITNSDINFLGESTTVDTITENNI